jgi:hypothetical protein
MPPNQVGDLQARPGHSDEDEMTAKFPAATRLAVLLATAVAVAGLVASPSHAQTKRQQQQQPQYDRDGRVTYGAQGPNRSYQQGPRTRVYVTTRSWLDAGTEVLPGDRKFQDYAFPSPYGYPTFARENLNRPIDRQPLNPASDLGGEPTRFPLY